MATNTFTGGATAVAQVTQKNVGSSTSGHTFIITLAYEDGSTVAVLTHVVDGVDAGSATNVCAEIVTEFNALTHALATPITATNSTSKLILTADTAGVPFYATFSGTGTWNTSGVTDVANAGGADWNTAANWSTAAVPTTGDTVYLDDNSTTDILYGLNQSAVDTITLNAKLGFIKSLGTASYSLKPGNNWVLNYGELGNSNQPAVGSPRFKLNFGSNTFTATVNNSGSVSPTDTGRAALQITGGSNTSKIYIVGAARVDVAAGNGETASLSVIGNSGGSSNVIVGSGCTLVTGDCSAGTTTFNCAMTTLSTTSGASVTTQGSGAITTASIGGSVKLNSTGTIGTLNVYAGGVANFSGNIASRTVSTTNLYSDGTIVLNPSAPSHITLTTLNKLNGGTLKLTA
jgi:hypothetical protein